MGFSLKKAVSAVKKVGRVVDPTNPKSPLGSVTSGAIGLVPGGAAVLGATKLGAGIVNDKSGRKPASSSPPQPAQPLPTGLMDQLAGATPASAPLPWLLIAAGLGLVLLVMRRK